MPNYLLTLVYANWTCPIPGVEASLAVQVRDWVGGAEVGAVEEVGGADAVTRAQQIHELLEPV